MPAKFNPAYNAQVPREMALEATDLALPLCLWRELSETKFN